jgi:Zn-dependent protease
LDGDLNQVQRIIVWALPVLFAITVHEVAHGWVAKKLGDPTAEMMGRLTLNPIKHIDPIGTVVLPLLMLWMGGFVFGWAKPVPITWENLKHPKRDVALVAVAGPGANLIMAVMWALIMKLAIMLMPVSPWLARPLLLMGAAGVLINLVLMALNLLPLPPLDGGRILTGILPGPWAWKLSRIEPYGILILLALLLTGILGQILGPIISTMQSTLYFLFHL